MSSLRRRLHLWVAAWLVFQVASLSALVPKDCCARHRPAAAPQQKCHENAAATQCPMRGADGTPCPMHARTENTVVVDHASHHRGAHDHARPPAEDRCSIHASCAGPMAALFALLSNYGVLADAFAMLPDLESTPAAAPARENLIARLTPPDTPPPRA